MRVVDISVCISIDPVKMSWRLWISWAYEVGTRHDVIRAALPFGRFQCLCRQPSHPAVNGNSLFGGRRQLTANFVFRDACERCENWYRTIVVCFLSKHLLLRKLKGSASHVSNYTTTYANLF